MVARPVRSSCAAPYGATLNGSVRQQTGSGGLAMWLAGGRRIDPHRLEVALDVARRLPDAVFILHQRDADEAFALLAEADARRHGHLGMSEQLLGELHRA